MTVTCCIRYVIDPFKRDAFESYARAWLTIIPACGGELLGYFMPWEGTNNVALALISFESLAAYERYRARLKADERGAANFRFAEAERLILANWRRLGEHRAAQAMGRGRMFRDYRLRVAEIARDYGMTEREQAPADSRATHGG